MLKVSGTVALGVCSEFVVFSHVSLKGFKQTVEFAIFKFQLFVLGPVEVEALLIS